MARLIVRGSGIKPFVGAFLLYIFGCLATLALALGTGNGWLLALFVSGAAALWLAWRHILWPDNASRYLSFGAVLLFVCLLNRGFFIADYLLAGARFSDWPFWVQFPHQAVFKGEFITITGVLLTILAWGLCGGMRTSPAVVLGQTQHKQRMLWTLYIMSMVAMGLAHLIPQLMAIIGQLLPTLLGLGSVCTFLIPMTTLRNDRKRLLFTIMLGLPFMIVAAGSGMKSNIIFSLAPSAVMAWRSIRHPALRASLVVAGLMSLALITSYVNFYRAEVWAAASNGGHVNQTVARDFVDKVDQEGLMATVGDGLAAFAERSNVSYQHGWAVSIADEQEFHPKLVFEPMTYVLIPRMLWPGKPQIMTGLKYSGLVFGAHYMTWSTSSTAAGFYPALYLGFGWIGWLFGALGSGAILAGMTRLARRFGGEFAAGLYIFSMLPFILRWPANWPIGVIPGPIIILVYLLVVLKMASMASNVIFLSRRRRVRSP